MGKEEGTGPDGENVGCCLRRPGNHSREAGGTTSSGVDHGGEEERAQVRTRKEVNAASPIVRVVQMLKDE